MQGKKAAPEKKAASKKDSKQPQPSKGKAQAAAKGKGKVSVKEATKKAKPGSSRQKALNAKKAALKGLHALRKKKRRTTIRFRRKKTLELPRAPKYPRKSVAKRDK